MKLGVLGYGVSVTPEMTDLKTMFPLLAHGMSRDVRPVLLQGTPGVRVTPEGKGMIIEWKALYGYYISGDKTRRNLLTGKVNRETIWRNASKFGHKVFRRALREVKARAKGPSPARGTNGSTNLPDLIEISTDEYYTLEDVVMDILDDTFLWQPGNIRESSGQYRWMGLGQKGRTPDSGRYPTNRLIIPDIKENNRDLAFRGTVVPMTENEDMPITTRSDWTQTSTICGIIHAFCDKDIWDPRISIWAAHFQKIYGPGMCSIDKLFTAACREGVTPRLSTRLMVGNDGDYHQAFNKLAALAITCKWFSIMYWGGARAETHTWSDNVGRVRYWISGTTPAVILQSKIERFARANMVIFGKREAASGDRTSTGASGLYYMPVTNDYGASLRIAFAALPNEPGATPIKLAATEEPRLYSELESTTLGFDKQQVLIVTDEQALSDTWYPTKIELSRSVSQLTEFKALGLRRYSRMVRDVRDPEPEMPLELLKTMMLGWDILYQPASAIFTGVAEPSCLEEFGKFELIPGRTYHAGKVSAAQ